MYGFLELGFAPSKSFLLHFPLSLARRMPPFDLSWLVLTRYWINQTFGKQSRPVASKSYRSLLYSNIYSLIILTSRQFFRNYAIMKEIRQALIQGAHGMDGFSIKCLRTHTGSSVEDKG